MFKKLSNSLRNILDFAYNSLQIKERKISVAVSLRVSNIEMLEKSQEKVRIFLFSAEIFYTFAKFRWLNGFLKSINRKTN